MLEERMTEYLLTADVNDIWTPEGIAKVTDTAQAAQA
jgi:hypothetical protein